LDELEEFHLIDRIRQGSRDHRYSQKKLRVSVHEAVSHGGPMIEAMIQIANACLFSIVPIAQCGIEGHDRFLDRRPFLLAASIFGYTRLPASLVRIRTRIPDILIPVCL